MFIFYFLLLISDLDIAPKQGSSTFNSGDGLIWKSRWVFAGECIPIPVIGKVLVSSEGLPVLPGQARRHFSKPFTMVANPERTSAVKPD